MTYAFWYVRNFRVYAISYCTSSDAKCIFFFIPSELFARGANKRVGGVHTGKSGISEFAVQPNVDSSIFRFCVQDDFDIDSVFPVRSRTGAHSDRPLRRGGSGLTPWSLWMIICSDYPPADAHDRAINNNDGPNEYYALRYIVTWLSWEKMLLTAELARRVRVHNGRSNFGPNHFCAAIDVT